MEIEEDIALAPLTTMEVGGTARFFCACASEEEIGEALEWAGGRGVRVHVLGGGSNTIFADAGFDGLVLKVGIGGVKRQRMGEETLVTAGAGEDWDALVLSCIESDLSGIECLSGIPGSVGASPIQNVGAYGQEVRQTVALVRAFDRRTLLQVEFTREECDFAYRQSRFKGRDRDHFIITQVQFRLPRQVIPELRYAELQRNLDEAGVDLNRLEPGRPASSAIRDLVLGLRRRKSMVLDPTDPNSRSVGSFFLNPVLSPAEVEQLRDRWRQAGGEGEVPSYPERDRAKVPAAWLVERAGFHKGFRRGGAGISVNHALAIISCGGGAGDVISLGRKIEETVERKFGVRLEREPVVVGEERIGR